MVTDSGTYIGNSAKEYVITVPDHRKIYHRNNRIACDYEANLACIVPDTWNATFVVDHNAIESRVPENPKVIMGNKNQSLASFFMVNDHVFMLVTADCPQVFADKWIPYYSKICSAFFVLQYRFSTIPLFEACPIPVFPLPLNIHFVSTWYLECQSRLSLSGSRDIPVFFSGRRDVRPRRRAAFTKLPEMFPGSVMNNVSYNRFSQKKYCDYMCRSKIAWCPRSVYCNPDPEENGVTGKECEAMCAQSMVIRHALHAKETEPRIAGVHFVEIEPLEKDLYEKLHYYLSHDDEREEIAYNGRRYYERNWSPMAQAYYLINRCLEAMGEPHEPSAFP